jgi:hypothetical protein
MFYQTVTTPRYVMRRRILRALTALPMIMVPAAPMAISVTPIAVASVITAVVDAPDRRIIVIIDIRTGAIIAGCVISTVVAVFRNAAGKRETRQSRHD